MVHNSCIFIKIKSRHTPYTIALKTGTYFGKKCDFLQSNGYVKPFKGAHGYVYFLKLYIILYFRASFQVFSNILTRFRRGGFNPSRKWTTEIPTQIRLKAFVKTDENPLSKNFQTSTLMWTSLIKRKQCLWDFLFSKPVKVTLGTLVRKNSFTKRRPSTKKPGKQSQQKYYCSTSRKVFTICVYALHWSWTTRAKLSYQYFNGVWTGCINFCSPVVS